MHDFEQDARKRGVVLYDQHKRMIGQIVPIVFYAAFRSELCGALRRRGGGKGERGSYPGRLQWQVEREGRTLFDRRAYLDLAAQKVGNLAVDRQAEPGIAVLTARPTVSQLYCFEGHPA